MSDKISDQIYSDEITENIDYRTFLNIIHNIPSCIFFKDTQLRYVFTTKHWEQLNCDDVIGKTDLEIRKDRENALLATEADKNIIETGKGCSYIIKSDIEGGTLSYLELIKEPIFDENNEVIGIVGLINDVTDKILFEKRLKELNSTDSLTGLLNRRAGVELIEKKLKKNTTSKKDTNQAFMLLDLNKFKHINDVYGHQIGDMVLKKVSSAIKRSLYDNDVAMRLGGDEFIIYLSNVKSKDQIKGYLHKLRENIDRIKIKGVKEKIEVSIGVKMVKKGTTFDQLYTITDKAMYEAKKTGAQFIIE